jgi:hypothetical protein
MTFTDEEKDLAVECAREIQSHLFRGTDPQESYKIVMEKYDTKIIQVAMEMVKESRKQLQGEGNELSQTINRCMMQVNREKLDRIGQADVTVEEFYEICEEAYHVFMNDDKGRALPIVFLFIKGNAKLGVVPIDTGEDNISPMDYLKQIVYQEKPDAYCFCGEASMNHDVDKSTHKYGDIINDPTSKDIVILQGNTKSGDKPLNKMFDIIEKKDKIELKPMKDIEGENMESDKLP